MKLLVVLQNAWFSDGCARSPQAWEIALWRSHTGKRLREMLPDDAELTIIQASRQIGNTSHAVFPPEPDYIREKVQDLQPDRILACGRVAQQGLRAAGIEQFISAPHPSYRALSKEMTRKIKKEIEDG